LRSPVKLIFKRDFGYPYAVKNVLEFAFSEKIDGRYTSGLTIGAPGIAAFRIEPV
jgi:hypothetical protein